MGNQSDSYQQPPLLQAAATILFFSILAKMLGFLREITLAYIYGAGDISDAYVVATTVLGAIFSIATVALGTAFLPVIVNKQQTREETNRNISNIFSVSAVLIFVASIICMFISQLIIKIFAVGFDDAKIAFAAQIFAAALPFYFLFALYNMVGGYLKLKGNYWFNGVSDVVSNIIVIATFILAGGVAWALGLGFGLSLSVPCIMGLVLMKRKGFRYSPSFHLRSPSMTLLIKLSIPIFFGSLVSSFNTLIDRNFASLLDTGVVSAMQYANKLNLLFIALFVMSITNATFATLTIQGEQLTDLAQFKKTISQSLNAVQIFAWPAMVALLLLAQPITELVFMRGQFSQQAANITATALQCYCLGMLGLAFSDVLSKGFYALKFTKEPVIYSVVSIGVNIALNFVLIKPMGYAGLCLATSVSAVVFCILLFAGLRKKIGSMELRYFVRNFIKTGVAALVMGVVVFVLNLFLQPLLAGTAVSKIILIATDAAIGAGIYFLIIHIMGVNEVKLFLAELTKKLGKLKAKGGR